MIGLQSICPGVGNFVRFGGTDDRQARNCTEHRQLFDRLMGRAVFTDEDGIMREDIDFMQLLDGGEAHRRLHVIGEDHERGAERNRIACKSQTVGDHAHTEFANAEVDVAAAPIFGTEVAHALQIGLRGGVQVGGTARQRRNKLRGGVHDRAARRTRRRSLFRNGLQQFVQNVRRNGLRQESVHQRLLVGVHLGLEAFELLIPSSGAGLLGGDLLVAERANFGGNDERFFRIEAEIHLRGGKFFLRQRRTMRRFAAFHIRSAFADGRLADDDRRFALRDTGHFDGGADLLHALAVDFDDVPAVGRETSADVFRQSDLRGAFDADAVVIIEENQIVQFQMAGKSAGFMGGAFHDAAVAADHIDLLVEQAVARADGGLELLHADRHTDGGGETGSQRASRHFDAFRVAIFRMAWALAAPLTERLQIIDRQTEVEQMQQRIDQHGAVARGEDETVAADPLRIIGIEAEEFAPQRERVVRAAHRHARMAGIGL